jgi:hypothetical protein
MTKQEAKMLKAAKKLEKITKKFLEGLVEVDETFQNLPTKLTRRYFLDEEYFKNVEKIISNTVGLEILAARLEGMMDTEN